MRSNQSCLRPWLSASARLAGLIAAVIAVPATVFAEANYVYHERTANNPGCGAGNYVDLLAPLASQSVTIRYKVEYQNFTDQTRLYYTTDGSTPSGALGVGSGTTLVVNGSYHCTFGGPVVDVVNAIIPAQAGGTTVKYIVSAWHSGGGAEIFANGPGAPCSCGAPTSSSALATVFQYTVVAPEISVQQPVGTDRVSGAASIGFGSVNVGASSAAVTFTITNSGTSDLTLGTISKDGANAGEFSVGVPGTTTLAPGTSTTFDVTFSPAALGARTAAIHIANNDSDENPFDIALTGTGVDTTPPAITCPLAVTVQCDADVPSANFSGGTATDTVDPSPAVTHVSDSPSGSCPKIITRTYRATDASGNTNDCTQLLTVADTTPPSLTCPAAASVQCFGDLPAANPGLVVALDNCGVATTSHAGDTFAIRGCGWRETGCYRG